LTSPVSARAAKGDGTPAGEKFCEILRRLSGNSSRIVSVKGRGLDPYSYSRATALAVANLGCYKCQCMKLPADAIIAAEKVTDYLLVSQTRGDKSVFLARGGYTIENAEQLLHDLRTQAVLLDATPLHSTEFGQFYEIRGPLVGPNGVTLQIRSIWMKENVSGVTKFITPNSGEITHHAL